MRVKYMPDNRSTRPLNAIAVYAAITSGVLMSGVPEIVSAQCSQSQAAAIAVDRYGGSPLSVYVENDYLIVRLRLDDGRVIEVAIYRGEC